MTIGFILDSPGRAIANGKQASIYFEINYARQRIRVKMHARIEPKYWDAKRQMVKRAYPGVVELNHMLGELKNRALSMLRTSIANQEPLDKHKIKTLITKLLNIDQEPEDNTFLKRFEDFISAKRIVASKNSIKKYVTCRNHLLDFSTKRNIKLSLDGIDIQFVESFMGFLFQEKKHLNNSANKQVHVLKGFLNWCVRHGYTKNEMHRRFSMRESPTTIIHLTEPELMATYNLKLKQDSRFGRARDLFCFQAFTGQRFSDVANLDWDDIDFENRWWTMTSQKTRDNLQIPLNDFAIAILKKYSTSKRFPRMSNQKLNQSLKEIGKLAGIETPFTVVQFSGSRRIETKGPKYEFLGSHVSRKTFVTLSLAKGMRPETVMAITGHRDFKTMRKYLKITDHMKEAEMRNIWSFKEEKTHV